MQVSTRSPADQRVADAVRAAPYLTHVIRHHGQLTLIPPDNAGRARKPKREKRPKPDRQERTPQEPQFNIGAPRTPRRAQPASPGGRSRTSRRREETDAGPIPDYPPPSFDEAVAASRRNAPPISPVDSTTSSSSSPDRARPGPVLIPPVPRPQDAPVVARSLPDPSSTDSVRYSTQAECDSDSDEDDLEVISTSEAVSSANGWEDDRLKGLTWNTRLAREKARLESSTPPAPARAMRPSPSQLTLTPQASQDSADEQFASSPSADSQADGFLPDSRDSNSLPVPQKRRLHILSNLLKSKDHHPASAPSTPTYAAASQLSLPLHFLTHSAGPNNRSQRGEGLLARKIFGHKGKDKIPDPFLERRPESLEAWDMLSDDDIPSPSNSDYPDAPASSASEHFPNTPGPSDSVPHLPSPEPPHESVRPKHHSMSLRPVLGQPDVFRSPTSPRVLQPPPTPTTRRPAAGAGAQVEIREAATPTTLRQPVVLASSATYPVSPTRASPPSPSQKLPTQSVPTLKPVTVADSPIRGRPLRASSSMIWTPGRRFSPVPSPTRSATTPTSPSMISLQSGVTNLDYDTATPATLVGNEGQEAIRGALHPSLAEEEEPFFTPPGSPMRSRASVPLPGVNSRHPSPVRHEGRVGVTLRDDGPVPPGSPTRSEVHARATRTPTITPRPSAAALHAFAPPTPSPLASQSFERNVTSPRVPDSLVAEGADLPRRDTVVSVGDTESLIELYVHSPGPINTDPASPVTPTSPSPSDRSVTPTNGSPTRSNTPTDSPGGGQYHHYPGRPLPHPPGPSRPGPVRPVSLDLFFAGGRPLTAGDLPPYEEVAPEKPAHTSLPPPPRPARAHALAPAPPPDDAPEPASPASVFEAASPASVFEAAPPPPREYTDFDALLARLNDGTAASGNSYEELLLVQDIMGPARAPATRANTTAGGAPLGRVEVARKRVTRDGRVKLKLVLLGVAVDRCIICMTQFRDSDSAVLGTHCKHAFHERCASGWIARGSRTCPTCRAPFE
ncbi:hypothetical protein BC834DRAFT_1032797 [Gloeopeniophorella convolvens]|nr:hypothetical protein BC834DRAFT_1032797 [Gloeopeniophorella convolvens]